MQEAQRNFTTKMTISFRVSAAADFSWRARMPRDLRALRSHKNVSVSGLSGLSMGVVSR